MNTTGREFSVTLARENWVTLDRRPTAEFLAWVGPAGIAPDAPHMLRQVPPPVRPGAARQRP